MAGNGRTARLMAYAAVVLSIGATRCAPPQPPSGKTHITAAYDPDTGRLERIAYDRDGNGKPDSWVFMQGTRVIRAEIDDDHDGVVDRWEYFASAGATPSAVAAGRRSGPVLERVETAARPGSGVTRREFYERGTLARVEDDTDADGRPDKWETWTAGALTSVALDTDGDGAPDRRIVYPADGAAPRFEVVTP